MSNFTITAKYKENVVKSNPQISNLVTINNLSTPTDGVTTTSTESTVETDEQGVNSMIPSRHTLIRNRSSEPSLETPSDSTNTLTCCRLTCVQSNDPCRILFERKLLGITLSALSGQDITLINNMVDKTGEIILAKGDLVDLIKILTKADDIQLITSDHPISSGCLCLCKIELPMWKNVHRILVNKVDFEICYNSVFSLFSEYKVTLSKVIE